MNWSRSPVAAMCAALGCTVFLLGPQDGWAFGANELQLCQESSDAWSISTYSDKVQEYMTERTGAVPGWLAAKAAKAAMKKSKTLGAVSGAAGELQEWCSIAGTDDEVTRAAMALAKLADKAGPLGAVVSAQMGAGLTTLNQGMKEVTSWSGRTLSANSGVNFCLRMYSPRTLWFDRLMDRSEVLADVSGIYMITQSSGSQKVVPAALYTNLNANQRNLACYHTEFVSPDEAAAAYAIRVDFKNGQRVYAPVGSLAVFTAETDKSLKLNAALFGQGTTLYTPR